MKSMHSKKEMPVLKTPPDEMEKIDGLGWTAALILKSYGVKISIRSHEPDCLNQISQHLPNKWTLSTSRVVDRLYSILLQNGSDRTNGRRLNMLYGNDARLAFSKRRDVIFEAFESDLRLFVA